MTRPAYETEVRISRAVGLACALRTLAEDYRGICNPDPQAHGIKVLIDLLEAEVQGVQEAYEAEELAKGAGGQV